MKAPFPPPDSTRAPPDIAASPLEVLRVQPQGPVAIAGLVSITFSAPMVPVETDEALSSEKVPARLEPEPPGQWRWAGTRTLLFEAKPRFPMATEYTLTIPAGVRAATGGKLAEPLVFHFTTPPPSVVSFSPVGEGEALDPILEAVFDQRIDPERVLATVSVEASGQRTPLALAPTDSASDRTLRFRAVRPLPKDAKIEVTIGPGTPSAEGPLTSTTQVVKTFHTFGPFRYLEHVCEWARECRPDSTLVIRFNNPIDDARDQRERISVSPRPEGMKIEIEGTDVRITGPLAPEARYQVTAGADLTDVHGQRLGRPQTVTFQLAPPRPIVYAPGERFVVLDPAALDHPTFPLYTMRPPKVQLRLRRVEPTDWFQYLRWAEDETGEEKVAPPGRTVVDRALVLKRGPGLAVTAIDLSPALIHKRGNVVLEVEPIGIPLKERRNQRPIRRWIQVTDLGLDAVIDQQDLYAFVTTLAGGRPLANAQVSIVPVGPTVATDPTGYARLPLPEAGGPTSSLLVAKLGDRMAFLPEARWHRSGTSWVASRQEDGFRFFMFDDRGLYRPGETVRFKGWVRRITGGKTSDVDSIGGEGPIHYEVRDARGNEVAKGDAPLTALGGFTFSAVLPKDVNLGWGRVEIRAKALGTGASGSYAFQVEEFRRPEFEVSTEVGEGPHLVGEWAELSVAAKYYSGGPLGDAGVTWDLRASPAYYAPPNREDYSFGIWTPWWGHYDFIDRTARRSIQHLEGKTGPDGVERLRIELLAANPPRAMAISASASVMDVNRQTWGAGASILVHPASVYVGLRPARAFFVLGEPIEIEAIRVDLDGRVAPGAIEMTAAPIRGGDEALCSRNVEQDAPVTCSFPANAGGPWRITARTTDPRGRPNQSERVVWVAGGPAPPATELSEGNVELIPDRESYAIGDVAELMVRTPFAPAEALVTLRRQGVLRAERIESPRGYRGGEGPDRRSVPPEPRRRDWCGGRRRGQAGLRVGIDRAPDPPALEDALDRGDAGGSDRRPRREDSSAAVGEGRRRERGRRRGGGGVRGG